MKKFGLLLVILTLASCSSTGPDKSSNYSDENVVSISSGNETSLGGPNFYVFTNDKISATSRSIASDSPSIEISDKKLYLYTLLVQHSVYKKSLNFNQDVKVCPQFHNDLVSDKHSLDFSTFKSKINRGFSTLSKEDIVYYPELALTVDQKPLYSYIGDSVLVTKFKNAMLKKAEQNLAEINSLCDSGHSDGFYVFSNLIKHVGNSPNVLEDSQSYKAIFKLPVIANMLILKGGSTDSGYIDYHPVESEILSRLNANWIKEYISKINDYRLKKVSYKSQD